MKLKSVLFSQKTENGKQQFRALSMAPAIFLQRDPGIQI